MDKMLMDAKAELAELTRVVERAIARKEELAAFIRVFEGYSKRTDVVVQQPLRTSARDRISAASAEILSDGKPRPTRVLLGELSDRGIEVGGENKIVNLSKVLGRDKEQRFVVSRKTGWTLTRLSKKEDPADVPSTGSGSRPLPLDTAAAEAAPTVGIVTAGGYRYG